jgi:ubiquinone/menaquinone biosynthesis C-methylase UbiE
MPHELPNFQTTGSSWSERAQLGELKAVIDPGGSEKRNRFLHGIHLFGAKFALSLNPNKDKGVLLDFGCGTGRFIRFFGQYGYSVIGTEITDEMLCEARKFGIPEGTKLLLTDGVHIPLPDQSVDMIWCCGVLRFSLFVPEPKYQDIAKEMYRIIKPGGLVVNVEVYTDGSPEAFTQDFEKVGFMTQQMGVLQRYRGIWERIIQKFLPLQLVEIAGNLCATYRFQFDSATKPVSGVRDYLFVWSKSKEIKD